MGVTDINGHHTDLYAMYICTPHMFYALIFILFSVQYQRWAVGLY